VPTAAPKPFVLRRILFVLLPAVLLLAGVELSALVVGAWTREARRPVASRDLPTYRYPRAGDPGDTDALQIVAVGDSWTWGHAVPPEDAYPAQLERMLREAGRDVQVSNLGEPGATPLRSAQLLRVWLDQHPADLVVVLTGRNAQRGAALDGGEVSWARKWLRKLASYRLVVQLVARGQVQADEVLERRTDDLRRELKAHPDRKREILGELSGLERIERVALAYEADLLVLTYGIPASLQQAEGPLWARLHALHEQTLRWAEARGHPVLDLRARYAALGAGFEVVLHGDELVDDAVLDLHPNAEGYALHARAVADWVLGEL